MNKVQQEWEKMRIEYQKRYAKHAKQVKENQNNQTALGQLLESSYVLINVFGLSDKEVVELEANNYCGLTDRDLEDY